jgi:hypothetical protein
MGGHNTLVMLKSWILWSNDRGRIQHVTVNRIPTSEPIREVSTFSLEIGEVQRKLDFQRKHDLVRRFRSKVVGL